MLNLVSLAAVAALSSAVLATPNYGYEAPSSSKVIASSSSKIPYPTAGARYYNITGAYNLPGGKPPAPAAYELPSSPAGGVYNAPSSSVGDAYNAPSSAPTYGWPAQPSAPVCMLTTTTIYKTVWAGEGIPSSPAGGAYDAPSSPTGGAYDVPTPAAPVYNAPSASASASASTPAGDYDAPAADYDSPAPVYNAPSVTAPAAYNLPIAPSKPAGPVYNLPIAPPAYNAPKAPYPISYNSSTTSSKPVPKATGGAYLGW